MNSCTLFNFYGDLVVGSLLRCYCSCYCSIPDSHVEDALYERKLKGGRGGVQAYIFLKHYFEIQIGGDGLDTYPTPRGGFGSIRVILPMWGLGAKKVPKIEFLTKGDRA